MAGMDWFRWHHGSVTDPKFQLVARKAGASVAEVIAVWATLLEEASQADIRGCHGVLDFEAIDCALGLADGKTAAIHRLMAERNLVDAESNTIAAWDKRQPKREREDNTSTERSRTHRANKAQATAEATTGSHATPCNATDSQETPRGEERREEKKEPKGSKGEKPQAPTLPGVSAELLADYMAVRKAKKAGALTQTAVDGLQREADAAGITLVEAVTFCCEAGWQGFNAGWYADRKARSGAVGAVVATGGRVLNKQEILEASNDAVVQRYLAKENHVSI